MAEGPAKDAVIGVLHMVGDVLPAFSLGLGHVDDFDTEEGDDGHGDEQRHHQVDGDGPGEVLEGVEEGPLEGEQERIEDGADADGGQHHGHEILGYRHGGGLLRRHALVDVLQIAVDDDDAVVDNHAEHDDETSQGDNVQLNARHIHDAHADEGAQGYGDGSDDGRAQGEEHHHDQDDDGHGDEQVAQEVAHTLAHHLWLVGYAGDVHIVGQHVAAIVVEHAVNVFAILHDVVPRGHLKREQHTGVTVLLDVASRHIIFAHHARDVPHPHRLATKRVAEDDEVLNLGLALLRGFNVDGCLLVAGADAAAQRRQPLLLQLRQHCLLADAVCLQALAVDIDGQLLLLFAVGAHVGH